MVNMLLFWAETLDVLGKVLVILVALLVHSKIKREGKIDKVVIRELVLERTLAISGVVFIIVGYLVNLFNIFG